MTPSTRQLGPLGLTILVAASLAAAAAAGTPAPDAEARVATPRSVARAPSSGPVDPPGFRYVAESGRRRGWRSPDELRTDETALVVAGYVTQMAAAVERGRPEIRIGVIGRDGVSDALRAVVAAIDPIAAIAANAPLAAADAVSPDVPDAATGTRATWSVSDVRPGDDLDAFAVVYVARSEARRLGSVLEALHARPEDHPTRAMSQDADRGRPLSIAAIGGFVDLGGAVELSLEDIARVRIARRAAEPETSFRARLWPCHEPAPWQLAELSPDE